MLVKIIRLRTRSLDKWNPQARDALKSVLLVSWMMICPCIAKLENRNVPKIARISICFSLKWSWLVSWLVHSFVNSTWCSIFDELWARKTLIDSNQSFRVVHYSRNASICSQRAGEMFWLGQAKRKMYQSFQIRLKKKNATWATGYSEEVSFLFRHIVVLLCGCVFYL